MFWFQYIASTSHRYLVIKRKTPMISSSSVYAKRGVTFVLIGHLIGDIPIYLLNMIPHDVPVASLSNDVAPLHNTSCSLKQPKQPTTSRLTTAKQSLHFLIRNAKDLKRRMSCWRFPPGQYCITSTCSLPWCWKCTKDLSSFFILMKQKVQIKKSVCLSFLGVFI